MKASFLLTLLGLILLSVFAASLTPPPPGGKRTTLVWATDNNPVRAEQCALFNRLNPDLFVMIDPQNADSQKVIVQSIGGVGPDLFDGYSAENLENFVRAGIPLDVTDDFKKMDINIYDLIWPTLLPGCLYRDRVYGFPRNAHTNAVWYNKDLFDKAGVPYPKRDWTWDDLIATAKKLTVRDGAGKAKQFGFYWDFGNTSDLIFQSGGRQFSKDGTVCLIDSPEAIDAVQRSRDLLHKYKIAPSPMEEAALATQGGWGSGGITFLMGGRVAMAYGGRWWLNLMRSQKGLNLGCVPLPFTKKRLYQGGGGITMINRYSPKKEAALRFLKFMSEKPYNDLINAQADAISPVKRYAYTKEFLFNPAYPQEDYNEVWRFVTEHSEAPEFSPFLKGTELAPLKNQMDLVKNDLKPVPEGMKQAAIDTNARIKRSIEINPMYAKMYREIKGETP